MARESPPWLLAYSGGLDSTVLLHALRRHYPEEELHAMHVHHGLQTGADAWEHHAREQAGALGVQIAVERLLPPDRFPAGSEAWARDGRWRALERYAKLHRIRTVLLAHHQQDQAETLLINLIRGTGVAGLRGMPRLLHRAGLRWLRPFLGVPKGLLLEQARRWGLTWVEDPSNQQPELLRNRVRLQVLPLLEEIRPGAVKRIAALAEDLGHAGMPDGLFRAAEQRSAGGEEIAPMAPVAPFAASSTPLAVDTAACQESGSSLVDAPHAGLVLASAGSATSPRHEAVVLDLQELRDCSGDAQRHALHAWVRQVTGKGPSRARLNVLHEMCFVARSAKGYLRHGAFLLRRCGNCLYREERGPS